MQGTTVEELLRQARRFEEETNNLKQFLDELTTDGAGLLYDLKMAVGAETDLGHAISSIGGVVRQAATSAVNALIYSNDIKEATSLYLEACNMGLPQNHYIERRLNES